MTATLSALRLQRKIRQGDIIESVVLNQDSLNGVTLAGAIFINVIFDRCDFSQRRLDDCLFERCRLDAAVFRQSELIRCRFLYCALPRADFTTARWRAPAYTAPP